MEVVGEGGCVDISLPTRECTALYMDSETNDEGGGEAKPPGLTLIEPSFFKKL